MRPLTWAGARHVLCVRLDTIGDVLMTTPALRALSSDGQRRITLLTSPTGAEVAPLVPEVDEIIVYDAPWLKASAPRTDPTSDLAMAERLRARRFDAAAIFTVYTQSALPAALLCHLAEIPLRLAHCRENPYGLLTEWVSETEPHERVRHEVQRQLDLVATVGCATADAAMSLRVPEGARALVARVLEREGLDRAETWAVVHPGASAPSRRYPREGFTAAARRLVADGVRVLFTGSSEEVDLVEGVRAGLESVSLAGRLDLAGLAALLERAPVLISNNTGPVHVACAVGTPVVDLYALTNPQHTPWGVPHRVLSHDVACKWCYKSVCPQGHHDCLRLVSPDEVVEAAHELLEDSARPSSARV